MIDPATPATVRAPDVAVVRRSSTTGPTSPRTRSSPSSRCSSGTRRVDRVAKVADYAEAGIGCYLLVEPGPPTLLTELRLVDGSDERVAEHHDTMTIALDGRAVTLDLAGMLDR